MFCATANTNRHINSNTCKEGTLRHHRRINQQHSELAEISTVTINNITIDHVDTFKYLGRHLTATSTDITAVNSNLQKSRKTWGRISTVLKREGVDRKTMANFYKTVVQASLLYASETWKLPNHGLQQLNSFHHKVARNLSNRHISKIRDTEIWVYPNMPQVLEELGLNPIDQYIQKRKKKLVTWAQNRDIYHQARTIELNYGASVTFWGPDTPPVTNQENQNQN
jgi:hypothetical protein